KDTALIKDNNIFKTNKLSQFWTHGAIPKADLANEGGVNLRRGKKPENLLKRIIDIETKEGNIVIDFFVGSGSTCVVSHKINKKKNKKKEKQLKRIIDTKKQKKYIVMDLLDGSRTT